MGGLLITYCPKCGETDLILNNDYPDICITCKTRFKSTNITTDEAYERFGDNWQEEIRKEFYYNNPEREMKCENTRKEWDRKAESGELAIENHLRNLTDQNVPKCPICGSKSLTRLSNAGKVAKVGLFGIFGAGSLGKTYKCNSCGSKF